MQIKIVTLSANRCLTVCRTDDQHRRLLLILWRLNADGTFTRLGEGSGTQAGEASDIAVTFVRRIEGSEPGFLVATASRTASTTGATSDSSLASPSACSPESPVSPRRSMVSSSPTSQTITRTRQLLLSISRVGTDRHPALGQYGVMVRSTAKGQGGLESESPTSTRTGSDWVRRRLEARL